MKFIRYTIFPFSILYGLITAFRNSLFNLKIIKGVTFDLPIISVGNLTAGGTGKSPHVEYFIKLLKEEYRVATLSRGYGRSKSGFHMVRSTSTVADCGDEPLQFKNKFTDIIVAVQKDRVNGVIELLKQEPDIDCILLDDCFQHRSISPGFNVLLTEYHRPFFKDWMLPTGNLREWPIGRRRANTIIVTKCPEELSPKQRFAFIQKIKPKPWQTVHFSSFRYGKIIPVHNGMVYNDIAELKEIDILLITGIANPVPIINKLESEDLNVTHMRFPDHHRFSDKDIKKVQKLFDTFGGNKIILTTEKDAQRLRLVDGATELSIHYLEIEVFFVDDKTRFNKEIEDYVRQYKTDSKVSEGSD